MSMEIARLYRSRIQEAVDLVWETFLKFEAPEYSEEGILTFHDFIRNERELERLEIFGAEIDGAVVGVLAMRGNHIRESDEPFGTIFWHRAGPSK